MAKEDKIPDWLKLAIVIFILLALYESITGGISKAFQRMVDPFGVGDQVKEAQENYKKALEKKIEKVKDIKTDPKKGYTIGKDYNTANANAKAIANVLYMAMEGVSSNADHLKVYGFIKALKTVNDVKLVYRNFGVRENENLIDWIYNENMDQKMKDELISKITSSINS